MEKSLELESLPLDGIIRTKEDIIEAIKKYYLLITGKAWNREYPLEILGIFSKKTDGSYINIGKELFRYISNLYEGDVRILDGTIKTYLNDLFDVRFKKDRKKIEIKIQNMWKEIFAELGLSETDFSYEFKHKKIGNVRQYDAVSGLPLIQLILYYKKIKYSDDCKKTSTPGSEKQLTKGGGHKKPQTPVNKQLTPGK